MAKLKIRGNDLKKAGVPAGPLAALAVAIAKRHYRKEGKQAFFDALARVNEKPEDFEADAAWGTYARKLLEGRVEKVIREEKKLRETPMPYRKWGGKEIDRAALDQMDVAVHLPVAHAGALMPDAHPGYGLPIGGVLAVENAVIPYGVGVDIGCRMCLSVFPLRETYLREKSYELKGVLKDNSRFGKDSFKQPNESEVLDRSEFREIPMVRKLKDKAYQQLGSSGGGNHFVEFGLLEVTETDSRLDLEKGEYVALLSHSGSRGLGANIAMHYTRLAMDLTRLPKAAKNLAWLDLDTEAGMEYWLAMNLAGDYASACHHDIHQRISAALGVAPLARVENHHNFAWRETMADGKERIIHRKGATPAGKGELGVIPGSMTEPGFLVRGKGSAAALNSASHGAGRRMSRKRARESFTRRQMKQLLSKARVTLIGGGLDEIPDAYKDINQVMAAQSDLVDVLGRFQPRIVRMAKD